MILLRCYSICEISFAPKVILHPKFIYTCAEAPLSIRYCPCLGQHRFVSAASCVNILELSNVIYDETSAYELLV